LSLVPLFTAVEINWNDRRLRYHTYILRLSFSGSRGNIGWRDWLQSLAARSCPSSQFITSVMPLQKLPRSFHRSSKITFWRFQRH